MPKIIPNFLTGVGPDNPRNQPDKLFFPSKTSDGSAQTVKNPNAPHFQAAIGARAGIVVPYNRPVLNLQINRVYCVSRRMFPRAF